MAEKFRISESNFTIYAMRNYENPHCIDQKEFQDDIKRIKYIKRLLNRFAATGDLKERLLLNHIILLYNVFGCEAATRMLFYKIDTNLWPSLKTFLIFLGYMPERVSGVLEEDIISTNIPINMKVADALRNIKNVQQN